MNISENKKEPLRLFFIDINFYLKYNKNTPPRGYFVDTEMIFLNGHKHSKAVINRLARSVGHLSAVKKMVEEGRDCSEVLIQLSAVKAEIAAAERVVLKDHLEHCIADAIIQNDEETIGNLMSAIDKII